MSKVNKYVLFCDKMSHWRSFGVSYNWDDGHYFGFYVYKYHIGIQRTLVKQAVVKTEDLRKDQ
jgi:hypothetical protein